MKQDIKSMNQAEIGKALAELGEPSFRAKQVFTWLHKGCRSFSDMTNLSKTLRQKLDDEFFITVPQVIRKQQSQKDGSPDWDCWPETPSVPVRPDNPKPPADNRPAQPPDQRRRR